MAHADLLRGRGRDVVKGFDCSDLQYQLLKDNYELTYAAFEKPQVTVRPDSLAALLYGLDNLEDDCSAEGCEEGDAAKLLDRQAGAKPDPVPALPVEYPSDPC